MHTRQPLYYTFGNHMHWVDMEWLWGYSVLPDSVQDMLHFCNATGAKGNLNFDAVGYERLAAESPNTLESLKQAIAAGQIEIVGASYGQPYGLFHGGESNIRQRVYGVRTVMRLLGVRPRTFWEEEFDFFPQLPQMLRGVGYEYACLFYQWTWHTPHMPLEDMPAVWWEGLDGSRLLTAPRHPLNLHQWPEDFMLLLESPDLRAMAKPCIVQWLELMPSPDWMCRAELMIPPLQQLMARPEFDLRFVTLSEYLEQARDQAQPRRYTLSEVFHGMSLGKNGDLFRRYSHTAEQQLLTAESLSATAGLFGRPYPHWDVYPTWELEEAWRELLAAQHHDNDECEGLCGHVGETSYQRSLALSGHVVERTLRHLAKRAQGRILVYNPLGWTRDGIVQAPDGTARLVSNLPPLGYHAYPNWDALPPAPICSIHDTDDTITLARGDLRVEIDKGRGVIRQIYTPHFPDGALAEPLGQLEMRVGGQVERFETVMEIVRLHPTNQHDRAIVGEGVLIRRANRRGHMLEITVALAPECDAVDVAYRATGLPRPNGGVAGALKTVLAPSLPNYTLIHDHPYGVSAIEPNGTYLRKYPTGDWMTSPQVFEEVHNPFTALSLLDCTDDGRGLLYLHDGSQAFLKEGARLHNILTMYDPWDEDYFVDTLAVQTRLTPHGALSHAERWRRAQEFLRPPLIAPSDALEGDLPSQWRTAWCDAPNIAITAFYRESERYAATHLDAYAGRAMEFPYVLRLIEWNGEVSEATVCVRGEVAAAFRTNLLGEPMETLTVEHDTDGAPFSRLRVALRPHEIATLYIDIVQGRKQPRNLDAYRYVWATVHRVEESF
ncbi:MAG: hypothetical protein KatS3mg019_1026 [Fimbriimonadales bacterium]|nr:MAG: hypothetical protein KatS3mg019_1026 [Fimbriimonadales bacterium]